MATYRLDQLNEKFRYDDSVIAFNKIKGIDKDGFSSIAPLTDYEHIDKTNFVIKGLCEILLFTKEKETLDKIVRFIR